jgi:hypothetical protein
MTTRSEARTVSERGMARTIGTLGRPRPNRGLLLRHRSHCFLAAHASPERTRFDQA